MSGRFPPLRFARNQVGEGSPTISANNLQSQKPARPGYYGQSIGHDITHRGSETGFFYEKTQVVTRRFGKKPGFFGMCASRTENIKVSIVS
jgi:hypothetical protein